MSSAPAATSAPPIAEVESIPLRDPFVAGVLAWLVPGLGHWYQGRYSKAVLFFVCIVGTFVYGMYLGDGRVVYASWRDGDQRLPYLCQVGIGLPSLPALVQAKRFQNPDTRAASEARIAQGDATLLDWFMVPPSMERNRQKWGDGQFVPNAEEDIPHELDSWHRRLHRYFELGTVFTMVAGLLNVLAIFDATGGPAHLTAPARKSDPSSPSTQPS